MMSNYELYDTNDEKIFYKICRHIEKDYPNLRKDRECVDVDGSVIVAYSYGNDKITIVNDITWGYIFAESNLDLSACVAHLKVC